MKSKEKQSKAEAAQSNTKPCKAMHSKSMQKLQATQYNVNQRNTQQHIRNNSMRHLFLLPLPRVLWKHIQEAFYNAY